VKHVSLFSVHGQGGKCISLAEVHSAMSKPLAKATSAFTKGSHAYMGGKGLFDKLTW